MQINKQLHAKLTKDSILKCNCSFSSSLSTLKLFINLRCTYMHVLLKKTICIHFIFVDQTSEGKNS